jgi:hypothetical protein
MIVDILGSDVTLDNFDAFKTAHPLAARTVVD